MTYWQRNDLCGGSQVAASPTPFYREAPVSKASEFVTIGRVFAKACRTIALRQTLIERMPLAFDPREDVVWQWCVS